MNAGVVRSNDILGGTRNHPALSGSVGNDGVFVGMERCSSLLSLDECSSCRGDVLVWLKGVGNDSERLCQIQKLDR